MHADEFPIDSSLVARCIAAQFPQWAELAIVPVDSSGTDNAIFRLGNELSVRMPRIAGAVAQVRKDQQWLPTFATHLPLAISDLVAIGSPGEGFPWEWSIYRWLEGVHPTAETVTTAIATDLAAFVVALRHIDTTGAPSARFAQGESLAVRDRFTREALASLSGLIDVDLASRAWEESLHAPEWHGTPVWVHGDLQAGNLLQQSGKLSGVIDFATVGAGDPSDDLIVAWNLFSGETRKAYRAALVADDAEWLRGRGWALSMALIALPYYLHTNPPVVAQSLFTIRQVLDDYVANQRF